MKRFDNRTVIITGAVVPSMRKAGGGAIVNISAAAAGDTNGRRRIHRAGLTN